MKNGQRKIDNPHRLVSVDAEDKDSKLVKANIVTYHIGV